MSSKGPESRGSSFSQSRRRFLGSATALAGAAALGGRTSALASGAQANRRFGKRNAQGQTEITIWTAFPELDTLLSEVGPLYTEANPDVKIVNTLFPQRALEEKVAAALPAGEGPDLIEMDRHEILPYYLNGDIVPYTGEMADYIAENWPATSYEQAKGKDGELYSLPWIAQAKMMFYNKKMFADAGIDTPPETVDEMMDMAEKLTIRDANGNITTQGIDLRLSGGGFGTAEKYWCQAMIPYGVSVLTQDGDKYTAGYDNEQGIEALNLYINALYERKVCTFDAKHDAEGFGLGQAAMFQRESWVVDYLSQNAPDIEYDVFPMPKGPGGWGTVSGALGLAMTSSAKDPDKVYDFVRWITNEENTAKTYAISGWQPWRTKGVDFGTLFEERPVLKTFNDVLNLEGHTIYDYENIPPVAEIYSRMADRLMTDFKDSSLAGNADAQGSAVHDMAEETNRILQDWDLFAG